MVNGDRVRRSLSVGYLQFIEEALQLRWRSAEDRAILWDELKNLQKGITTPLEVSHDHLLATPPSHFPPRKVGGFVVWFTGLRRGITFWKILSTSKEVKGKIAYGNSLGVHVKVDDFF